ncbi:hypothetical protein [Nocardioides sp. GXZ039]|uniref:hypothetical protein n=1 Tax=Nocardioides sp. GXZ039 TaxID=3136018 RepID=UPI0030F39A73
MNDEELFAELAEALADPDPDAAAVTARRRAAAQAAFTWRTVDAELAELLHDSALESGAVRSAAATDVRTLSYGAGGLTLELEIDGDVVLGQLVGGTGSVVLRRADGTEVRAEVDPAGFFRLDTVAPGPVRFVAGPLTTPWLVL